MTGQGDMGAGGLKRLGWCSLLSLRYFLALERYWDAAPWLTQAYCFIDGRAWRADTVQLGQPRSVFPKRVALLELAPASARTVRPSGGLEAIVTHLHSPACCQVVTNISKVHRSTSTLFTHQNPRRQKIHLTFVHIITSPIIPTEPTTCTKTPQPPLHTDSSGIPTFQKTFPHPAAYFPKILSSGDRPKNKKRYENTKEKSKHSHE